MSIIRNSMRYFYKREINEINIIIMSQEEETYVNYYEVSVTYD